MNVLYKLLLKMKKNGINIRFSFDKEFKEDLKNNIEKIIHIYFE